MTFKIDWDSNESQIFLNPKMPILEKSKLENVHQNYNLKGHFLLATSGSTAIDSQEIKWVALKKSAFLIAAQSVNKHLNCTSKDVFLNTLPCFHVGGLGLMARAFACNGKLVDIYNQNLKWNPTSFVNQLTISNATITSLVPSQIYDCVLQNLKPPKSLRACVIGGGFLTKNIFEKATLLGWKLLPSYGMSECCSQIATANFNFEWINNLPNLTILPHCKVTISLEGTIEIESDCLLTGYILQSENAIKFIDPKVNGKIKTHDIGKIVDNKLIVFGRQDENIKIHGENISLNRLQSIMDKVKEKNQYVGEFAILAIPDIRKGYKIGCVFEGGQKENLPISNEMVGKFNELVFPFEKIEQINFVKKIPKTDLGKFKRNLLLEMIG